MDSSKRFVNFRRLAKLGVVLALCVVMLGAWVRLSDAGLGCPDWPGCYGQLTVPETASDVAGANSAFPERPVEAHKAWKEMVHRYLAGSLGLVIAGLFFMALRNRAHKEQPLFWPTVLVLLVIFQAALGMWTVTLKLKPLIVMGHLLGGFATLSLLWWLVISTSQRFYQAGRGRWLFGFSLLGVAFLCIQIALGGWTSSNYAALACPDFPQCQQQWWPAMDFKEGFVLWRGLGQNYEFGVLEHPARTAVHMAHRLGALFIGSYLLLMLLKVVSAGVSSMSRSVGAVALILLLTQIGLGISNVVFHLPLYVAVAHNGVAAMLLLSLITLSVSLYRQQK